MAFSIYGCKRWLARVLAGMCCGIVGLAAPTARADGGAVYILSNAADGNALAVFNRNAQGGLTLDGMVPTGGLGTGAGLASQGALAFGSRARTLYAVNAGSGSLTVFRLSRIGPVAIQVIDSMGQHPISVTVFGDWLYVLNADGAAGGTDHISGFRIDALGRLQPLANSSRPLSAANVSPAQVGFSENGEILVVTEKGTNQIDTFRVRLDGLASGPIVQPSAGMTPYGFAFNEQGYLIVSEAFGGNAGASAASSYEVDSDTGRINVVSASVPTNQTAACWVAVTGSGKFAYTTNTGSGTVTGYAVAARTGALSSLNASGMTGVTGGAPIDAATIDDRLLYALSVGSSGSYVVGFVINLDGSLVSLGAAGGLPQSAGGLVAE